MKSYQKHTHEEILRDRTITVLHALEINYFTEFLSASLCDYTYSTQLLDGLPLKV